MSIYRGPGGAGDATNDATVTEVQQLASEAAASAASAQTSANNSSSSASAAATSATNASNSASAASGSAGTAASSASAAATSATNASNSASAASTSATNASNSATAASNSATSAANSASAAATSATNASNSASSASTSATNAANSAASALAIYGTTQDVEDAITAAETAASNAAGSASLANSYAIDAADSASDALNSAGFAQGFASQASSSASAASVSASNAANSAADAAAIYNGISAVNSAVLAAQAAQAGAEAAFDAFDDIYLGAKSSNPTVDNDGNALTTGDQYFNTVSNELRVWNGSSWQAASVIGGTVTSLTVTGATALNGGTTLGDASGDALTINSNSVSIPNGLSFTGGNVNLINGVLTITNGAPANIQAPNLGTLLHLAGQTSDGTGRRFLMDAYNPNGPVIMGRQSNGTPTARAATAAGNVLLFINSLGSIDNAGTVVFSGNFGAYQRFIAAENFTPTAQGTAIDWSVNPIGSATPITTLSLNSTTLAMSGRVAATQFTNAANTGYAKLIPSTAHSKKVVVFGSSVAFGTGATSNQGWAYMLGQALTSRGWTYSNISIGGNNTVDLINRFYTDLVPQQPDVVIIGLSLANEGILGANKQAIFDQYINNMYKLVDMCRQQGFKVIVTGTYPNNSYTSVEYNYIKQADKFLQTSQIPYINFLGAIDDGTGKWRTGMFSDGGHPNDVGHTSMFRAIPLSLFDRLSFVEQNYSFNYPPASRVVMTGDTSTPHPIDYTVVDEPFGSWTMILNARMINSSVPQGVALTSIYNGNLPPLRLRAPLGVWEIATGAALVSSSVAPSDLLDHQIAVSYDYFSDTIKMYVDGVYYGASTTSGFGANPTKFGFLGRLDAAGVNANGFAISNLAIYKTALNADQIAECNRGFYPKASLQVFAPCTDNAITAGNSFLNLAPTNANLIINTPNLSRA